MPTRTFSLAPPTASRRPTPPRSKAASSAASAPRVAPTPSTSASLDLDPSRKDAGLIVGMYRYAVSSLSLPSRLMARLAGFGGGRDRGLRMVEEAAALSERRADERALHADRHLQPRGAVRRCAAGHRASCSGSTRAIGCCGSRRGSTALRAGRPARRAPVARARARHARRRPAAARVRRAGPLGLLPRRRARGAEGDRRRRAARSTRRSAIRRGTGCRAASTPSSASSPTSPAIALAPSRSIARRSVCADG